MSVFIHLLTIVGIKEQKDIICKMTKINYFLCRKNKIFWEL